MLKLHFLRSLPAISQLFVFLLWFFNFSWGVSAPTNSRRRIPMPSGRNPIPWAGCGWLAGWTINCFNFYLWLIFETDERKYQLLFFFNCINRFSIISIPLSIKNKNRNLTLFLYVFQLNKVKDSLNLLKFEEIQLKLIKFWFTAYLFLFGFEIYEIKLKTK